MEDAGYVNICAWHNLSKYIFKSLPRFPEVELKIYGLMILLGEQIHSSKHEANVNVFWHMEEFEVFA